MNEDNSNPMADAEISSRGMKMVKADFNQDKSKYRMEPIQDGDPKLQAVFEKLSQPMHPFKSDDEDSQEISREHLNHHIQEILEILCLWARSLKMTDQGGRIHGASLLQHFMARLDRQISVDLDAAEKQSVILPEHRILSLCDLDGIDLQMLWILAAFEIDPEFKQALSRTWDQNGTVYVSPSVMMRFFCENPRQRAEILRRLSPSGKLCTNHFIQRSGGQNSPLYHELHPSEQIVNLFTGVVSLSLETTEFAELQFPHFSEETFISASHQKAFDTIRNFLERPPLDEQPNLERENLDFVPSLAFLVEGLPGTGRCTLVKWMASNLGMPVIIVMGGALTHCHSSDLESYLSALFNDAWMQKACICFRDAGLLMTDDWLASLLARQLSKFPVVCAFCVELALKSSVVIDPYITFKTRMDGNLRENAVDYWKQHLNLPDLDVSRIDVEALSERIALQPFQIQKAAKLAYYQANSEEDDKIHLTNRELEKAAALQVTKNIGNLAFVTDPEVTLDDVILSNDIMAKIRQIIGSATHRRRVLYEWGLSHRIRRGTGIIALFDGEPGTGKTHSAEAIANALGLSLMRVNIASMVDKYIGETEKNLTVIFEQARPDMQLLLFDEADSLFAKRTSNVEKSNDRYSNMSVNVLLQLVERYEGISILTTNLKNALDPAFERRITYKVYFPMPKKPERLRLWQYMCPPEIRTSEPIDYEWLSELEMSGGEIKNAVLTAAFNAATKGVLLNSEILYDAGVSEASASGRVMRRYSEKKSDF